MQIQALQEQIKKLTRVVEEFCLDDLLAEIPDSFVFSATDAPRLFSSNNNNKGSPPSPNTTSDKEDINSGARF